MKEGSGDLEAIRADVASFAAGLGFGAASDGFNDVDFRKKGQVKKRKAEDKPAAGHHSNKKEKRSDDPGKNAAARPKDGRIPRTSSKKEKRFDDPGKNAAARPKDETIPRGSKSGRNQRTKDASVPSSRKGKGQNSSDGKDSLVERGKNSLIWKDEKPTSLRDIPPEKENKFAKHIAQVFGSSLGDDGEKWYEVAAEISLKVEFLENEKPAQEDFIRKKLEEAELLLKRIAVEFEKSRKKDADMKWIISARRSGTSADKVAAMSVLIQEHPVANAHTFDNLLGMITSKAGKRHALGAIDVLTELFVTILLPDRKLKHFSAQPLGKLPDTKQGAMLLVLWYWEDFVKRRYKQYVDALVDGSKDSLSHLKLKSLKALYVLLKSKPELERQLLVALINKLGDPERKPASNAAFFLSCLLKEHPRMKKVVLDEVEPFVFRPNLGLRPIYYAIVFLSQLLLSSKGDGPDLAKKLIDIYFGLFKTVTTKQNSPESPAAGKRKHNKEDHTKDKEAKPETAEIDSRLLSAILTGVNRAFPYVNSDDVDRIIEEHTPSLFHLVHSPNLNVGIQALMLLYQLLTKHQAVSDRFHRAIYAVLLSPSLEKSSKMEMFLGLLFKVLKADVSSSRISAFVKRLLQVALHQLPQSTCASLLLESEVLKTNRLLWNYILEAASQDDDVEHFRDVELPDEAQEESAGENAATVVELEHETDDEDGVGSGFDISLENEQLAEELGEDDTDDDDDDNDSDNDNEKLISKQQAVKKQKGKEVLPASGNKPEASVLTKSLQQSRGYDPQHRDPLHCKADSTCWWELTMLATHYHPSVSTMAKTLLSNTHVVYAGNPLHDLAFGAFLDRFAEKKQKAPRKTLKDATDSAEKELMPAVLGTELASLPEDEVAPADMVFHRFYTAKAAAAGKQQKRKNKKKLFDDGDETMLGSDEDEDDEDDDDDGHVGGFNDAGVDDDLEAEDSEPEVDGDGDGDDVQNQDSDDVVEGEDSEDDEIDNLLARDEAMEVEDESDLQDSDEDDDDDGFIVAEELKHQMTSEKRKAEATGESKRKESKSKKKAGPVVEEKAGRGKKRSKASPFASAAEYAHLVK